MEFGSNSKDRGDQGMKLDPMSRSGADNFVAAVFFLRISYTCIRCCLWYLQPNYLPSFSPHSWPSSDTPFHQEVSPFFPDS